MRNSHRWLLLLGWSGIAPAAQGQILTSVFPEGVPGYGTAPAVTVLSRARPAFDPLGVRAGLAMVRPRLDLSFGFDDNIFAGAARRGGWRETVSPSVLVGLEGSGGAAAAFLSVDDIRYLGDPSQNRTDGAAFLGGTRDLGHDRLTLAAGFLSRHEDQTALDALPSDRPVAFQVANARAAYEGAFGPWTLTPSVELSHRHFDDTTIRGVAVSQAARDRTTVQGGATARYAWMPGREFVALSRVLDTVYQHPATGAASNNAVSTQVMVGVDYDDNSVWRYRVLAGVEYRVPASSIYRPQTAGIAEMEVIWQPSGLTTVRATGVRGIEDAAQTGLSTYTYSSLRLAVDHELLRNVILSASATARTAEFEQTGGHQTGYALGVGATWLVNRDVRLSLTYDYSEVRNTHLASGIVAGNYARNLVLMTLRLAL